MRPYILLKQNQVNLPAHPGQNFMQPVRSMFWFSLLFANFSLACLSKPAKQSSKSEDGNKDGSPLLSPVNMQRERRRPVVSRAQDDPYALSLEEQMKNSFELLTQCSASQDEASDSSSESSSEEIQPTKIAKTRNKKVQPPSSSNDDLPELTSTETFVSTETVIPKVSILKFSDDLYQSDPLFLEFIELCRTKIQWPAKLFLQPCALKRKISLSDHDYALVRLIPYFPIYTVQEILKARPFDHSTAVQASVLKQAMYDAAVIRRNSVLLLLMAELKKFPIPLQASDNLDAAVVDVAFSLQSISLMYTYFGSRQPTVSSAHLSTALARADTRFIADLLKFYPKSIEMNQALFFHAVASRGLVDILKNASKLPFLNPSVNNNEALMIACAKGSTDLALLLLGNKNVLQTFSFEAGIRAALLNFNFGLAEILFSKMQSLEVGPSRKSICELMVTFALMQDDCTLLMKLLNYYWDVKRPVETPPPHLFDVIKMAASLGSIRISTYLIHRVVKLSSAENLVHGNWLVFDALNALLKFGFTPSQVARFLPPALKLDRIYSDILLRASGYYKPTVVQVHLRLIRKAAQSLVNDPIDWEDDKARSRANFAILTLMSACDYLCAQ